MKIAVISDIHANVDSLIDAIELINQNKVDKIYSLGDNIGYLPFVNETLDIMREYDITSINGNHELYYKKEIALPIKSKNYFTWYNKYLDKILSCENKLFLSSLKNYNAIDNKIALYHGSPNNTEEYVYLNTEINNENFKYDITFLGHTHIFMQKKVDGKIIINPGSIGQNRLKQEPNNLASFVIFDTISNIYQRVTYEFNLNDLTKRANKNNLYMNCYNRYLKLTLKKQKL